MSPRLVGPKVCRRVVERACCAVRCSGAAQTTRYCEICTCCAANTQMLLLQRGRVCVLESVHKFGVKSQRLTKSLAVCDADYTMSLKRVPQTREWRMDYRIQFHDNIYIRPANVPANYPGEPTAVFDSNVCSQFKFKWYNQFIHCNVLIRISCTHSTLLPP